MTTLREYKMYFIFFSAILVGLLALLLVSAGYYPIGFIDGHVISAKKFMKNYTAASLYYENAYKTYQPLLTQNPHLTQTDLQVSVLDQLVENTLIEDELRKELGGDFTALLQNKMNTLNEDPALPKVVSTLYGMNIDDFRTEILTPQAERELLIGRLFLQGKNIDTWLMNAKKASSIRIFSGQLYWNGMEVKSHGT